MSCWSVTHPELSSLADQWALEVGKGDVIRTKSGDLRVVREVHRHQKAKGKGSWGATIARRTYCFFAIRSCSWTGRPYTLYSIGEMVSMGWVPTSARPQRLDSGIDRTLEQDFGSNRSSDCALTCCGVRGLP